MREYKPKEIEQIVREEVREFLSRVDWEKFNPQGVHTMVALLKEILSSVHHCMGNSRQNEKEVIENLYTFVLTVLLDFVEEAKATDNILDTKNETKH